VIRVKIYNIDAIVVRIEPLSKRGFVLRFNEHFIDESVNFSCN